MNKIPYIFVLIFGLAACSPELSTENVEDFEENFIHPSSESGPETWWHWLNGNISREGITRDLEELKDKGYRGATAFSIGHNVDSRYAEGPVKFMSPEWYELFHHAVTEADRLGLKMMFHNCDGWATSGGPWIKPEDAMKELVYSEMDVKGPRSFHDPLPTPRNIMDFYEDIAVMAYPVKNHGVSFMKEMQAGASANTACADLPSMFDNNPTTYGIITDLKNVEEVAITLTFPEPVSVSKLVLFHTKIWGESVANQCELFAGDQNGQYHSVLKFNHRQPFSQLSFKETRAKDFKLVFHSFDRFDRYVIQQKIKIQEFHLLPSGTEPGLPLISDWDNKAGFSNFRVRGDYRPQKPVDQEHIIPVGKLIDLSEFYREGQLQWEVPAGDWKIIRLGYTTTGKPNEPSTDEGRGLECDKFSASSVEKYFMGFPEKILSQNKAFLGKTLHAMLIDSWEAGNQNWSRDFESEFEKRRGYSMSPWLPVLTGRIVESVDATERFLWDFRRTFGDLIAENYFGKMRELSNEYGISLQAEAAHVALQFMVDAINYHSMADIPMNEFWIQPDKIGYDIRQGFTDAASAAHLYDKDIVACESFTCGEGNWRHSPYWLKPAADKVFCMGVNRITFDTYTHQPDERKPGWNLSPWGLAHNRKLTWWDFEKPWIEYITRCQYLLQKGDHVADFLVFTGEGVPSFLPVQSGSENGLIPGGYAFDGCNSETLLSRIRVKEGRLILPHGPSYRAIILPETELMTPELAEGLAELVKKGAVIFGPKPSASPSLQGFPECDSRLQQAADLVWGDNSGNASKIHHYGRGFSATGLEPGEMTKLLGLKPDFEYSINSGKASMEYIHKRAGNTDIYFIANQDSSRANLLCTFRINNRLPELWFPDRGEIVSETNFRILDERIELPVNMEPYGSVFVVFRDPLEEALIETAKNCRELTIPEEEILESIPVTGSWQVEFQDGMGAPASICFEQLASWTEHEDKDIKYYSGTSKYRKTIHIPEGFLSSASIYLSLGDVRDIAKVFINGTEVEIIWKPPYTIEAGKWLKPGENSLEIQVVNTWTNRLIGDLFLPDEQRNTWVNCCLPLNRDSELMKSGLLGPVKLIAYEK